MRKHNRAWWIQKVIQISWVLMLVTLPITSFPYFPGGLGGATMVRPLAVYPLLVLLVLVTLPRFFTRPLPRTYFPLLAFIVVALASSLVAMGMGEEVRQGVTSTSRLARNLITLAIGGAFYFTVTLVPRSWQDLKNSLRWILLGFGVAFAWGSLQAVYVIHFTDRYFYWISRLQEFISSRKLFEVRVSGMTYEPKWFAEQICFLLLPWLLASVFYGRTVFKWRYRWITVELIMLVWSAIILVFTFSRTGYVVMIAAVAAGLFLRQLGRRRGDYSPYRKNLLAGTRRKVLASVIVIMTCLLLGFALSQNRYLARTWRFWVDDVPTNKTYLEYIAVGQRFVYLQTALKMYQTYPILGVGLGNYAFYFEEMLPNQPYFSQPEITRQLTPTAGRASRLITPKNLYARILSETGLLGIVTFAGFVFAVLGSALYLWFSGSPEERFWGFSGLIGIFVFLIVAFSVDSFAIPNMWMVFGFITAAAHLPESIAASGAGADLGEPAAPENPLPRSGAI
jgi:O-Antigen ligase